MGTTWQICLSVAGWPQRGTFREHACSCFVLHETAVHDTQRRLCIMRDTETSRMAEPFWQNFTRRELLDRFGKFFPRGFLG
jgi:hypothetical protein